MMRVRFSLPALTITLTGKETKMVTMQGIYDTLWLVKELDMRDSPSGDSVYSLVQASFLKIKLQQGDFNELFQ